VAVVSFTIALGVATAFATGLLGGRASPAAATVSGISTKVCRSVQMKLSTVTRNPDGSAVYHWTGGGTWSDETVPAPGFNPLTASNAELKANGFPPRPPVGDPVALKGWKTAMEHSKKAVISAPVVEVGSGCSYEGTPDFVGR
jgi:hypothetical protein